MSRSGGISIVLNNDVAQMFNSFFLTDLILYERLKVRLSRLGDEVSALHDCVGRIDAAIAVASYQKSADRVCEPDLRFGKDEVPSLSVTDAVHPLLRRPVANSADIEGAVLLTGSNASGKSTWLKTVALSAILAQSIATAPCTSYRAAAFRVYTSIALSDDILAGESYFITELKAFKRILTAVKHEERVLCAIDEVLRGTNTVERIVASSTLLDYLAGRGTICLTATHDLELCSLLSEAYTMAHLGEDIVEGRIVFAYRLRPGVACTRNAIRLLSLMGFGGDLTDQTEERAKSYLSSGHW